MNKKCLTDLPIISQATANDLIRICDESGDGAISVEDFFEDRLMNLRDENFNGMIGPNGIESVAQIATHVDRRHAIQYCQVADRGRPNFLVSDGLDVSVQGDFQVAIASGDDDFILDNPALTWTLPQNETCFLWIDEEGNTGHSLVPPRYEQDFKPHTYGANVATGGTASASSTSLTNVPENAFNGIYDQSANRWASSTASETQDEWIAYDFGVGNQHHIRLMRISIWEEWEQPSFAFEISDDGAIWEEVGEVYPGSSLNSSIGVHYYIYLPIPSNRSVQYVRLRATSDTDAYYWNILNIELYEAEYQPDLHLFDIPTARMLRWTGSTWDQVDRLFVGEAVTNSSEVLAAIGYAPKGRNLTEFRVSQRQLAFTGYHYLGQVPRKLQIHNQYNWFGSIPSGGNQGIWAGKSDYEECLWDDNWVSHGYCNNGSPLYYTFGLSVIRMDRNSLELVSQDGGLARGATSSWFHRLDWTARCWVDRGWL